jgi:hypothetical protein
VEEAAQGWHPLAVPALTRKHQDLCFLQSYGPDPKWPKAFFLTFQPLKGALLPLTLSSFPAEGIETDHSHYQNLFNAECPILSLAHSRKPSGSEADIPPWPRESGLLHWFCFEVKRTLPKWDGDPLKRQAHLRDKQFKDSSWYWMISGLSVVLNRALLTTTSSSHGGKFMIPNQTLPLTCQAPHKCQSNSTSEDASWEAFWEHDSSAP